MGEKQECCTDLVTDQHEYALPSNTKRVDKVWVATEDYYITQEGKLFLHTAADDDIEGGLRLEIEVEGEEDD